ncbi:MAG: alpha/beta hydrolase [Streptosporangiales bacterium]|nr:alpha/beta hydrolase [Streptosporangiales bacterium]
MTPEEPIPGDRHDPVRAYETGRTTAYAARGDQRFSYCLYVPEQRPQGRRPRLVVLVHGTERGNVRYRDAFAEFGERHGCVILAPLFPAGIDEPRELHNYKFIEYRGIRYDQVLLDMVDEVAERYDVDADRFLLHGFSGGGQFTHRFLYLHPDRLACASIGAPGRITRLDDGQPWWLGTQGFGERFGREPDIETMRTVAVQMVVGDRDVEGWEINNPGHSNWMDGAEKAGATRVERLRTLRENYLENGIGVRFDLVPGVAHEGQQVLPVVRDFFRMVLLDPRATCGR